MKIKHEQDLLKQKEDFLREKKKNDYIYNLNKQKTEEERKRIEYNDLMEKIRLKKNYDEEIKLIDESYNIAMVYVNEMYQHRMNELYNNNNIY